MKKPNKNIFKKREIISIKEKRCKSRYGGKDAVFQYLGYIGEEVNRSTIPLSSPSSLIEKINY